MERGGLITRPVQQSHRLLLGSLIDLQHEDQKLHESNFTYQTPPCIALSRGAQGVPCNWKDYTPWKAKWVAMGLTKGPLFNNGTEKTHHFENRVDHTASTLHFSTPAIHIPYPKKKI